MGTYAHNRQLNKEPTASLGTLLLASCYKVAHFGISFGISASDIWDIEK